MEKSKYQRMPVEQIISTWDINKKVIDYHYEIETEAFKTDDVYDGTMVEFVANELADIDNDVCEYEHYERIAKKIMGMIADEVAEEINELDRDAMDYENERREARKGNY